MGRLPLEGTHVVEVGQIVAGPTAGLILADMGADVIKVEPPDAGTPRRPGNLRTGSFFFFNRNKRSLVVDLATPEGHQVALRLVRRADVLIENMAPGTMERLGLGYSNVREVNPRLVYCSLKGYLAGPHQSRPLMDEPAQMASGLAYMTGLPGRPLRAGASVVDIGAATYAVVGVLAALLERQTTGEGQHITGGLFETALFYVGQHMAQAQLTGQTPPPMTTVQTGAERRQSAIYDLFTCRDGRQVFIGIVSDNQWRRFCSVFGVEDVADDPRLQHNAGRAQEREWLLPRIAQVVAERDSQEVVDILVRADVTVAPVHTPLSVLEDPHVSAEHRTLPAQIGETAGRLPPLPFESNAYGFSVRRHAPSEPGRHTREVLRELGYSDDEAEALARRGIVRGAGYPPETQRLTTPRIAPLPFRDWDAELRARFERPGGLGQILNVMGTLANHPDLFRRWVVFANHFLFKSTLTPRAREIVILRTAWLAGSAYEWGQHRKIAAAEAGFGEAEFIALAEGASSRRWGSADAVLIRVADGLYVDTFVDDPTWEVLASHYDERQILDVILMASNYLMLAMALNAFGVQLDEGYEGFHKDLPVNDRRPSTALPPMGVRRARPRLAPLSDAALSPGQREVLTKARGHLASVNVLETLVRHPDLMRRWMPFFNHVLHKSTLPARDRELLILRTGRLCGAAYEWAQHVPFAERAGLTADEIRGIALGAEAPVWADDHDRALLRAADQLHRETMLDDAVWNALATRDGIQQLMDVVFTVGQYRLVSAALNTLCVPLDAYLAPYAT